MSDTASFSLVTSHAAQSGILVVAVVGEVDMNCAGEFKSALDATITADTAELVIDLGETIFVDSHALAVLHRITHRDFPTVTIVCPHTSSIRRVLDITGIPAVDALARGEEADEAALLGETAHVRRRCTHEKRERETDHYDRDVRDAHPQPESQGGATG